jgi:predicted nucleic acid-binding protein
LLVIDASVAVEASLSETGFDELATESLTAPPLLWSEATAALHELGWRRAVPRQLGWAALDRLSEAPITSRRPTRLLREAWRIADDLGWAKTYDAEYVALARILGCRLVTVDYRLRRAARRLVDVVGPTQL